MAQSTSNGYTQSQEDVRTFSIPVAAQTQIWAQRPVCVKTSTGQEVPASDTSGLVFNGMSIGAVNNLADTVGGALNVDVQPLGGTYGVKFLNMSGNALQSWIGKMLYFIDDQTVGLYTATSNTIVCGRCAQVWATGASGQVCIDVTDRAVLATT